jgi:hypothetical protein
LCEVAGVVVAVVEGAVQAGDRARAGDVGQVPVFPTEPLRTSWVRFETLS